MTIPHLPARYDHVGSFLRPQYLLEAREKKATGQITAEQLRLVEDQAITEIVKFQEDVGLKSITDGEFRRTYFHIDFLEQLGGVKTDIPVTVRASSTIRASTRAASCKSADATLASTRGAAPTRDTSNPTRCLDA